MSNQAAALNFANNLQAAMGLEVSAKQFLKTEGVSALAFSIAAQESDNLDLATEFGLEAAACAALDGDRLEELTRWFLRKIWAECDGKAIFWAFAEKNFSDDAEKLTIARLVVQDDADGAMAILTHVIGSSARVIGKAADAIESRFGCAWGRSGGDVDGLIAHIS